MWGVRIIVKRMPFWLDSDRYFTTREDAQKFADRWKKRTVTVLIDD